MKLKKQIFAGFFMKEIGSKSTNYMAQRSVCEQTVIERILPVCDEESSSQWCIDEIQKNLRTECGNHYSCLLTEFDESSVASLHDHRGRTEL